MPRGRPAEPDFRALFAASPAPMLVLAPDLTVAAINDAFLAAARMRGASPVGRALDAILPAAPAADTVRATLAAMMHGRRGGRMAPLNWQRRRGTAAAGPGWQPVAAAVAGPDGAVAWVVLSLMPVAAGAAAGSLDQLASIVENSSELVAVANANLRLLYVNEAGRRLVGLDDLAAARRKRALQFFFPADRRRVGREIFATVREEGRWAGELVFRHFQTGAAIPVLYDVFRIDDPATGEFARYAALARDLTERKQADELLQQSQKMEAVGQLTGGVAHDFNNLLTAITGSLELLEPRLADEASRRLLRTAQRGADRGAELTSQLLAFSRKQRLAPEVLDINALIRGMGDLLQRTIGTTIEIRLALAETLWPALVDASQTEVAVLNLALNARDATAPGGLLTIATRNVAAGKSLPPEIAGKDCVIIAVIDTGSGMSTEVAARAFDPFFTTKEVGKGSGLGLSQVYGVVSQSGGAVRLRSREGKGTTIELFLPRAAQPPPRAAERGPAALARPGGTAILLVDDDPDVRAMTAGMLRELGHSVAIAASGGEALRALGGGATCELLVIDLAMPGMTGAETITRARLARPGLAALVTTGYADAAVFGDAVGDVPLLRKPFNLNELAAAVADALQPSGRHRPAPRRPRRDD